MKRRDVHDPLPNHRRAARTALIADEVARLIQPGDDLGFEASRYGVRVDALRRRIKVREDAAEKRRATIDHLRPHLPEGPGPWSWRTPEELARVTGDSVDDIRSAMNSRAHSLLQPTIWQRWVDFRDRERRSGPGAEQ